MSGYSSLTLAELLDAFASSQPVPGGGSAAALTGAVGASLLIMMASLPKTRSSTDEERAVLSAAAARLRPLRDVLADLVDRDSAAYASVLDAFRLPKASEQQQAVRKEAIASAMRAATEAPLDTLRACQQIMRDAPAIAANGPRAAASDAAVAIELLKTAAHGAALNVDANVSDSKDSEYVMRVTRERDDLVKSILADAEQTGASLTG